MKGEYGKYYKLNNDKFYYCVTLQKSIKFSGILVVKCDSAYGTDLHFGYLVDTGISGGPDYDTNNEIEFCDDDIISEYTKQDMPLYYNDSLK